MAFFPPVIITQRNEVFIIGCCIVLGMSRGAHY